MSSAPRDVSCVSELGAVGHGGGIEASHFQVHANQIPQQLKAAFSFHSPIESAPKPRKGRDRVVAFICALHRH